MAYFDFFEHPDRTLSFEAVFLFFAPAKNKNTERDPTSPRAMWDKEKKGFVMKIKNILNKLKLFVISLMLVGIAIPAFAVVPAQYTELEYIQSTGTQWIDTGFVASNGMTSYIDFADVRMAPAGCLGGSSNSNCVYGATYYGGYGWIIRLPQYLLKNNTLNLTDPVTDTWTVSNDGIVSKNYQASWVMVPDSNGDSGTMVVFSNGIIGKLKHYTLWSGSTKVFDGTPARRNSDNVIGMYDTVSGTFFTNSGTGSFIAGPNNSCANLYDYSYQTNHFTLDGDTLSNIATDSRTYTRFVIHDDNASQEYASETIQESGNYTYRINVLDNAHVRLYHSGANTNLNFFESTQLSAGKYMVSFDVLSANPSVVGGLQIQNIEIKRAECVEIQVATTQHVAGAFSGLNTQLTAAIATVNSVVTNTIDQANRIAALATGKQTRPTDTCPQYRQCLLVEGTDGTPHWYEINDPFYNFFAPILATNTNGTSSTNDPGYQQLEYIESTGTQWIDTGIDSSDNSRWEIVAQRTPGSATDTRLLIAATTGGGDYVASTGNGWNFLSDKYIAGNADVKTSLVCERQTTTSKLYVDGVQTSTAVNNAPSTRITLFGQVTNNVFSYAFIGKVYSAKLYDNNTLVRNFHPVRRLSDSALGMYDTVSKTFFANAGSGTFTAGPNVTNDSDVPSGPTWSVTWTNNGNSASGTVYGEVKCNNVSGTSLGVAATSANLSSSAWNQSGADCWCRATGLTSGGDTNTTDNDAWVFYATFGSAASCANGCAYYCASNVHGDANFRSAIFNAVN